MYSDAFSDHDSGVRVEESKMEAVQGEGAQEASTEVLAADLPTAEPPSVTSKAAFESASLVLAEEPVVPEERALKSVAGWTTRRQLATHIRGPEDDVPRRYAAVSMREPED